MQIFKLLTAGCMLESLFHQSEYILACLHQYLLYSLEHIHHQE